MTMRPLPPLRPAVKKLLETRPRFVGCGLEELVYMILEAHPHLTDEEVEEVILATRVPGTPPRPITLESGVTLVFSRRRPATKTPDV